MMSDQEAIRLLERWWEWVDNGCEDDDGSAELAIDTRDYMEFRKDNKR